MTRKTRGLRPEEKELWQRVVDQAVPLHPKRKELMKEAFEHINLQKTSMEVQRFKIGERVATARFRDDIAPTLTEHFNQQPVQMDKKAYGKLKRGKLSPEGRIDLHGMTMGHAHPVLLAFIMRSHADGKRLVLVITGKGKPGTGDNIIPERRGILRHQVPNWLSMPPLAHLVMQVTPAHLKHGGGGAYYVYLRRSR